MLHYNKEPNTVPSKHQKAKMKDKTKKQPTSPMLPVLKGLIIIVAIISMASAVAIAISLNLSANEKVEDVIDSGSTTTVVHTTTTVTSITTTVRTTSTSTTYVPLPHGTITHQYQEFYAAYLACPNSMIITILYGFFGVPSCADCSCGYCLCSNMTITSTVDSLCTNSTQCSFNVDTSLFGDACISYSKTLIVTYDCY